MEERQPSAAVRARQTMTLKPFCVSKTRKGAASLRKLFSFFFPCHTRTICCSLWTDVLIDWPTCSFTDKKVTRQPCQHRLQGVSILWINGWRISEVDSAERSCPALQEEGQIRLEKTLSCPATACPSCCRVVDGIRAHTAIHTPISPLISEITIICSF